MRFSISNSVCALITMCLLVTPAVAQGSAVAAANASVDVRVGDFDGGFIGAGFKGTMPLGERFGAQLDLGASTNKYFGVAGHLFWRDPSLALVGIVTSIETLNGADVQRFGVEGELYYDKFTLFAQIGGQNNDGDNGAYGKAGFAFYAQDSLKFTLSGDVSDDDTGLIAGLEWKPEEFVLPGSTLFVQGRAGDETGIYMGWRMDLGPIRHITLIDRDRYYDPVEATWSSATMGGTPTNDDSVSENINPSQTNSNTDL